MKTDWKGRVIKHYLNRGHTLKELRELDTFDMIIMYEAIEEGGKCPLTN